MFKGIDFKQSIYTKIFKKFKSLLKEFPRTILVPDSEFICLSSHWMTPKANAGRTLATQITYKRRARHWSLSLLSPLIGFWHLLLALSPFMLKLLSSLKVCSKEQTQRHFHISLSVNCPITFGVSLILGIHPSHYCTKNNLLNSSFLILQTAATCPLWEKHKSSLSHPEGGGFILPSLHEPGNSVLLQQSFDPWVAELDKITHCTLWKSSRMSLSRQCMFLKIHIKEKLWAWKKRHDFDSNPKTS